MPEMPQTVGGPTMYTTGSPELAVAESENGASPYVRAGSGPKLMLCVCNITVLSLAVTEDVRLLDTLTTFVTNAGAFGATLTVTVIGG
jgi:hypothetical protein